MCVSSTVVIPVLQVMSIVFSVIKVSTVGHTITSTVLIENQLPGRGIASDKLGVKMRFFPETRSEFAIWPLAPELDLVQFASQVWRTWIRRLVIRHLHRELNSMPDWLLYD